jgi:four helix bundle protein
MYMSVYYFKDLIVWKISYQIGLEIHNITKSFPVEERYGLSSQIRNSSKSISYNIAEGFGRESNLEFRRFLYIARGSLYECQNQLMFSKDLNFIDHVTFEDLYGKSKKVEALLAGLIKKLKL